MSEEPKQKAYTGMDEDGGEAAPHPLERWMKRELQALHGDPASEPLPANIAVLAAKLQKKLKRRDDRGRKPDEDQ